MVAHYGGNVIQQIGDHEGSLGVHMIVPKRMLKNQVIEQTGINSFALFSEAATQVLRLSEFCDTLYDYKDSYEHIGEVKKRLYMI